MARMINQRTLWVNPKCIYKLGDNTTFKKSKQEISVGSLLIAPNVSIVMGMCAHSWLPHFHAQFALETYSLHKDGDSANEL